MLEANIVTALTECTEHLILIGDYNQSRPKSASEELGKYFKLNVSLFERFILNELEYHQLEQTWVTPLNYECMFGHPPAEEIRDVKGTINTTECRVTQFSK